MGRFEPSTAPIAEPFEQRSCPRDVHWTIVILDGRKDSIEHAPRFVVQTQAPSVPRQHEPASRSASMIQ
jgi:hypothetical protein